MTRRFTISLGLAALLAGCATAPPEAPAPAGPTPLTDAQIVDRARMMRPGEEFFRTMAESARRAVLRASPLRNLPSEQYNQWREITFTFRPPA